MPRSTPSKVTLQGPGLHLMSGMYVRYAVLRLSSEAFATYIQRMNLSILAQSRAAKTNSSHPPPVQSSTV